MDKENREWIEKWIERKNGNKTVMHQIPGMVAPPPNIERVREEKEVVRYQAPKTNGAEICKRLRTMRAELAAANNIVFFQKPCHYNKSCAGTCPVCDDEIRYINKELNKIPPEQRIYPDQYMKIRNGDR